MSLGTVRTAGVGFDDPLGLSGAGGPPPPVKDDDDLLDAYSRAVTRRRRAGEPDRRSYRGVPPTPGFPGGARWARDRFGVRFHVEWIHPDEQPRRPWQASQIWRDPGGWDALPGRPDGGRPRDGHRRHPRGRGGIEGRRPGRLPGRSCRATGDRDRASVRVSVHGDRRGGQCARADLEGEVGTLDRRRLADRCGLEPRQLGRAARQLAGRGHRREHGGHPPRAGNLLRDRDQHRQVRRRPLDPRRAGQAEPDRSFGPDRPAAGPTHAAAQPGQRSRCAHHGRRARWPVRARRPERRRRDRRLR